MGRVVLTSQVSIDGYIEAPGRDISWHMVDDELHTHFNQWLGEAGAFLDGRVAYEMMAEFWPTADSDPDAPAPIVEFARIWRDMPKVVYSRTLERADDWNTTLVREVVPDEVRDLAARAGGDLVIGGGVLATTFLRLDLVDEFRIYTHPVLLGDGTPLFPRAELDPRPFRLVETRTFGNGVAMQRHERADRSGAAPA